MPASTPSAKVAIRPASNPPVLSVMAYNAQGFIERDLLTPAEIKPLLEDWTVVWVNIDGVGSPDYVAEVGQIFGLHPLALEDIMHLQERAKVDDYDGNTFMILRMVADDEDPSATEQISLFVTEQAVLTFQEREGGDCLHPTRERIRKRLNHLHLNGTPYLVYSILDSIVQAYFPVLERYGETLETLEEQIALDPQAEIISQLHQIKRELLHLRRAIWPLREVLQNLMHDSKLFEDSNVNLYLRNCSDHVLRVIDLIEVERELCADLMDFYLSSVGHRTNQVMKVLTIISVIFMPLTFIAGVYGMNFNTEASPLNMPELNWFWGYPATIAFMLLLVMAMLYLFRRLKWL
jgi:magnesium transporter